MPSAVLNRSLPAARAPRRSVQGRTPRADPDKLARLERIYVTPTRLSLAIDRLIEQRTTFVVTHRLSTLRNVDRILVLEQGRCIGFGTHEELLRSCPLYQRMLEAQQDDGGRAFASPTPAVSANGADG